MSYSPKYLEHFTMPKGVGELDPHDALSEVEHKGGGCFDRIKLTLLVEDGKIKDSKFRARACSGTIAACSSLTVNIIGLSVEEAHKYSVDDLIEYIGGIPEKKQHSFDLAIEALKTALENLDE